MEDAPLNIAHFHERRAEKHLKYRQYEDALKCLEKSLCLIQEAYNKIKMPKAIEVLIVQEKEYKRRVKQIQFLKACRETLKMADETSNDSNQSGEEIGEQCFRNSDQVLMTVDRTMKEFDARFDIQEQKEEKLSLNNDDLIKMELKAKDIPHLAPLELPSFDYKVFHRVQSENFKKPCMADSTSSIDKTGSF